MCIYWVALALSTIWVFYIALFLAGMRWFGFPPHKRLVRVKREEEENRAYSHFAGQLHGPVRLGQSASSLDNTLHRGTACRVTDSVLRCTAPVPDKVVDAILRVVILESGLKGNDYFFISTCL